MNVQQSIIAELCDYAIDGCTLLRIETSFDASNLMVKMETQTELHQQTQCQSFTRQRKFSVPTAFSTLVNSAIGTDWLLQSKLDRTTARTQKSYREHCCQDLWQWYMDRKIAALVMGRAQRPKRFGDNFLAEFGIHYLWSKRLEWTLKVFRMVRTHWFVLVRWSERKIMLLTDNTSSHKTGTNLPIMQIVQVTFLQKYNTILQPMDLRIIACIKERYRWRPIVRAVDLVEVGLRKNL